MKKKILCLVLVALLLSGCAVSVTPTGTTTIAPGTFTTIVPGTSTTAPVGKTETWTVDFLSDVNLNPHRGESFFEMDILHLLQPPLVEEVVINTETGETQWVFVAATDIQDVTKDNRGDLTKYNVTLPKGVTAEEVESGYVYEIKLRPEMKWEDGTAITADDYLYSMKALLTPALENSGVTYYGYSEGESALAGAKAYYIAGQVRFDRIVSLYEEGETPDYSYDLQQGIANGHVYLDPNAKTMALYPAYYNLWGMLSNTSLMNEMTKKYPGEMVPITEANYETLKAVIADAVVTTLKLDWNAMSQTQQEQLIMEALWVSDGSTYPATDFDTVGLYKVDDYTIRYVCQEGCEYETFLQLRKENWLVHQQTYEASMEKYPYTSYGQAPVSCGPYKVDASSNSRSQLVLVQNEHYWGYTQNADGTLSAMTPYEVDGVRQTQYEAQKIIVLETY